MITHIYRTVIAAARTEGCNTIEIDKPVNPEQVSVAFIPDINPSTYVRKKKGEERPEYAQSLESFIEALINISDDPVSMDLTSQANTANFLNTPIVQDILNNEELNQGQKIFRLHMMANMTAHDISRMLSISESTVTRAIRAQLRADLNRIQGGEDTPTQNPF